MMKALLWLPRCAYRCFYCIVYFASDKACVCCVFLSTGGKRRVVCAVNEYRSFPTILLLEYYSSVGKSDIKNTVMRFSDQCQCLPTPEFGVSTDSSLGITCCTCLNLGRESGARYACVRSIPSREPIYWRAHFRGWRVGRRWGNRGRRVECRPPTALPDRKLPPVGHGEVDYADRPASFQWLSEQ